MPGTWPRLPVVSTLEDAIRATGWNLLRFLPIYLLAWIAMFATTPVLRDFWFNELGWRVMPEWVLYMKDAPLQAMYSVVFLRLGILGIKPSKTAPVWDGTVARVAVVLAVWFASWALLDGLYSLAFRGFLNWTHPTLNEPDGWTFGSQAVLYFWGGWLVRFLKLCAVTCIYGQAAIVVAHGRFDWREHLALLRFDPVRLGLIVLAAAVVTDGLELFWQRVLPFLPSVAPVPVTNSTHWPEALLPTLLRSFRLFPMRFLSDVFGAMLLSGVYLRLNRAAKNPSMPLSSAGSIGI
jgi:hypothetical protein